MQQRKGGQQQLLLLRFAFAHSYHSIAAKVTCPSTEHDVLRSKRTLWHAHGVKDSTSCVAALQSQGAQQQLQRIELLVKIQQYDNARMQLRQGSFKSLRSDLRYESEYRGVQPEVREQLASWVSQLMTEAGCCQCPFVDTEAAMTVPKGMLSAHHKRKQPCLRCMHCCRCCYCCWGVAAGAEHRGRRGTARQAAAGRRSHGHNRPGYQAASGAATAAS